MRNVFVLLSIFPLLFGCATKVPFTHELRSEYNLAPDDLRRLQYYLSDTVVLQREVGNDEIVTVNRRVKIRRESSVEQVVIRRRTPGVAVGSGTHSLDVSFEHGNQIKFGIDNDAKVRRGGVYQMMLPTTKDGQENVIYGGATYSNTNYSSDVYILVVLQELEKFRKISRRVKGRRL